jgi:predicted dehydrogenase
MCSKLKAAVIGCGMAAKVDHIRWYAKHPDVELVALVDPNSDAAMFCTDHRRMRSDDRSRKTE